MDGQSFDVSLYKYLDDQRSRNSYSQLPSQSESKEAWRNSKGVLQESQKDAANRNSKIEYNMTLKGGVTKDICLPGQYRICDRGQVLKNQIFAFPKLESNGVKMEGLDSELAINRDLLKTGKGYLDVCKGLLDSIKAVNVGDVRFA